MAPETGIGTFAFSLFNEMRKRIEDVGFLYTGYSKIKYSDGTINYDQRFGGDNFVEKFLIKLSNRSSTRKLDIFKENNFHLCGNDYSFSRYCSNAVATVHDLYYIQPSLRYWRNPKLFPTQAAYNFNVMRSVQQIKKISNITTISEVSGRQIKAKTGRSSTVIYHWADDTRFFQRNKSAARRMLGLPMDKKIFLNVSGGGPNKNLGLLSAFSDDLPEGSILLKVGYPLSSRRCVNLSNVSAERYPLLFNASDAYVHTSSFEGFGRPLLEALSSALPIIATDSPSSREILESAAIYFKNNVEPTELIDMIKGLTTECITDLKIKSLERACFFSRERIIAQYMDFYKRSFSDFQS